MLYDEAQSDKVSPVVISQDAWGVTSHLVVKSYIFF